MAEAQIVDVTFYDEPKVGTPVRAKVESVAPGVPTHPGPILPGDPDWGPPYPPSMGDPHSTWKFQDGGWYFVSGPYPKPVPIACVTRTAADDPIKGKWTLLSDGWYFVAGPFDKPFPICDTEVPPDVPTEPPTEPPTGATGDWKYDNGWYFCYGPLDKPQPPPVGGGEPPPLPPGS